MKRKLAVLALTGLLVLATFVVQASKGICGKSKCSKHLTQSMNRNVLPEAFLQPLFVFE